MSMADWVKKLDGFLQFNKKNILVNAGKISHQMALNHAEKEFEKYEVRRRAIEASEPMSDFDKMVRELPVSRAKKKTR
ncbi:MAG: virulence RhuM family protein [Bdellovibrionaceae bacterium]|nr:virulence RhuM family protein [Pseudobdellovibrionaceae bacterium]